MKRFIVAVLMAGAAVSQTKVDFPTQIKGVPLFSDAGPVGSTLQSLCTGAGTGTLAITKIWAAMATQSIPCNVQFTGGMFQPASGKTVTISGFDCPQTAQCFDASLGGSFVLPARSTVTPNNFGAIANGTGVAGTDFSTKWGYALNALNTSGGGSLFIPRANSCYWAQNIILYSNITLYSDSEATCVQKPAGGAAVQMFTTAQALPLTNVHFSNFTIDGNFANQGTLAPDQNGMFGILAAGWSNSSITNMVIKNQATDGILISGAGTRSLTTTANAVESTCTITGASWSGGIATYTCSAPHGMGAVAHVTVTGISPSGWGQSLSQCAGLTTTTFTCPLTPQPSNYSSGGTATWSTLVYVSGEPFANMQLDIVLTSVSPSLSCQSVSVNQVAQTMSCATDQGTHSGIVYTISNAVAYAGDNLEISNNLITQNQRNGISQLCGTNTHVHNNHISYTGGILSGPWAAIDAAEPYQYGCIEAGSDWLNNEFDHNEGNGLLIGTETTFDPNNSPVALNINAHDNGYAGDSGHGGTWQGGPVLNAAGIVANGPFGPTSSLTISGTFQNNGGVSVNGGAGIWVRWSQGGGAVTIPWISTAGSTNGVVFGNYFQTASINGGTISATTNDIGFSLFAGESIPIFSAASLIENTFPSGMVISPLTGILSGFGVNCIPVWGNPGSPPRIGQMNCNGQIFSLGGPGVTASPGVGVTDGTHTGIYQYDANTGVVVVGGGAGVAGCLTGDANDIGAQVCIDSAGANVLILNPATSGSGGSTMCWNPTSKAVYMKSSGGCP